MTKLSRCALARVVGAFMALEAVCVAGAVGAASAPKRPAARPAAGGQTPKQGFVAPKHVYFEAEEFFSLQPVRCERKGFFGSGYREPAGGGAPGVLDKTVFLFGQPGRWREYAVWVRAWTESGGDRRVAVEWVGEEGTTRFQPSHKAKGPAGFRWERVGPVVGKGLAPRRTVFGRGRAFYQLRLCAVGGSQPIVDAVLLTRDLDLVPKETVRPRDDPRVTGGDGEGATRIDKATLVAGGTEKLCVTYTVGESGIAEGGALRFFLAQSWSAPQTQDPKAAGYVSVATSRKGVELAVACYPVGKGAYAHSHELRHAWETWIRVRRGALKRGDTVTIAYAGRVQPYIQSFADHRNEVRAWYTPPLPLGIHTDADGDGRFRPVAPERSHRLEIVPGKPARLHVVAPSIVKAGERLSINVAALDAHNNHARTYRGEPTFTLVDLATDPATPAGALPGPAKLTEKDAGHRRLQVAEGLSKAGAYAIRVGDAAAGIGGLSNPIRCLAEEPAYRVFWGDMHTHHRRCDGLRTFEQAAAHARDAAGLDVLALSPHACYLTDGDLADLWRLNERLNAPGRFATVFAYEWAAGGRGSAHSVIYSEKPMPLCFRAWGGGNVVRGRGALHEELRKHKLNVVEVPHHVRGLADHDGRYQKAIEIYSQWGPHEGGVSANLDAGRRLCFFGGSDNHTGQPGMHGEGNRWSIHRHTGGLTAFLAPKLTRKDLFEAVRARRCYATSTCRILADFTVDSQAMGGELTAPSSDRPREIKVWATASRPIARIDVLRNGLPINTARPGACVVTLRHRDAERVGGRSAYYYVRITLDAKHKAWLSPVWVTFDRPLLRPEQRLADRLNARKGLKNLALGRPVTTSFAQPTYGRREYVTDGKTDNYLGYGGVGKGKGWAQVDLGAVCQIGAVRVWHYFRDGRAYHGNRILLSATGRFAGEETVVFDSTRDGEYRERPGGRVFAFKPVRARYVRNELNRNTSNPSAQWVELEVYAPLGGGKEPATRPRARSHGGLPPLAASPEGAGSAGRDSGLP